MNSIITRIFWGLILFLSGTNAPLPAAEIVDGVLVQRDIPYRSGESKMWRLDLAIPQNKPAMPLPVLVLIHGGGWVDGDKSNFATIQPRNQANIIDFARLGFASATINYRLSREKIYPAGLEDCECAIRWLRAHAGQYGLDPTRIGAWGNSAGGHLALMLALPDEPLLSPDAPWRDYSSRVQSAASDSGPVDLVAQYRQGVLRGVVDMFMGGAPDGARLKSYETASPSMYASKIKIPLLLIYGVADEQVPVETADHFVVELQKHGLNDLSYHRIAATGHCPHSLIQIPWTRPIVNEFFTRTLKLHGAPTSK